ncbi:hypothetical protein CHS0354_013784 [Potamilus streckersoni]|uniref:Protein-glucosylgalactosylhydroxylysine glucosidase n=1 Tax=Potamilus streckersoni TaxID=2493646 RepID=A0AAE0VVH7_9BIVA|nr:hypothetical protein CHS0354_013784 [Potamilus streckersoni]
MHPVSQRVFTERYQGARFSVTLDIYAHRGLSRLIVSEVTLQADTDLHQNLTAYLSVNRGPDSDDIDFKDSPSDVPDLNYMYGTIKETETATSERVPVHIYYSSVPDSVTLQAGQGATRIQLFLMSVSPFKNESRFYVEEGLQLFFGKVFEYNHTMAWSQIWSKGRLDMEGDKTIATMNYACLYYILSSLPSEETSCQFVGLSPGDLAHGAKEQDYQGHVFWDQETWMYPPILALHADMAKTIVGTRIRTLGSAIQIAENRGYRGAQYPWESAFTGFPSSPSPETLTYEQHITGDIALAFRQYLMITRDTDILTNGGLLEAVMNISEFWASRVIHNGPKNRYEILDVMPPDEYHWPVNNSVYTNCIAQIALLLPKYAMGLLHQKAPVKYEEIANKMYIPFDNQLQYHPEYDGYTPNVTVKQADVVLLGYPLMVNMTPTVRKNDLVMYEKVTPGGPAMTWGMFAIGWLELGDSKKADDLFRRQLLNAQAPFNVWTESSSGDGAVNFITGMGGYLQSIIYGYGGFRLYSEKLDLNPIMPDGITRFNITGFDYLQGSLDFSFQNDIMTVTLTSAAKVRLALETYFEPLVVQLKLSQPVTVRRQKASIVTVNN